MSQQETKTTKQSGYRFGDAWRSLQKLRKDPDDTGAVFEIIDALSGPGDDKNYRRWAATEGGRRILAEKRDILPLLQDRGALLAMPEGSLGREYALFTAREEISADGLVAASREGRDDSEFDEGRRRFAEHLRDTHDLEHVITGWGRDLRGEASLLSFGLAQAWNHGIALIVAMAYFESGADERRLMREGWRRGRRATWLGAQDYAALLPRPLAEVRRALGVEAAPAYEPLFSAGAPGTAAAVSPGGTERSSVTA